jgi:hypothetical protein
MNIKELILNLTEDEKAEVYITLREERRQRDKLLAGNISLLDSEKSMIESKDFPSCVMSLRERTGHDFSVCRIAMESYQKVDCSI